MTEIPESVMEEARKIAGLIGNDQPVYYECDVDVFEACLVRNAAIVAAAILAAEQRGEARERERLATRLFDRGAFMISVSGPIPRVEVRFKVLGEMQDFHAEMVELSRATIHNP